MSALSITLVEAPLMTRTDPQTRLWLWSTADFATAINHFFPCSIEL